MPTNIPSTLRDRQAHHGQLDQALSATLAAVGVAADAVGALPVVVPDLSYLVIAVVGVVLGAAVVANVVAPFLLPHCDSDRALPADKDFVRAVLRQLHHPRNTHQRPQAMIDLAFQAWQTCSGSPLRRQRQRRLGCDSSADRWAERAYEMRQRYRHYGCRA